MIKNLALNKSIAVRYLLIGAIVIEKTGKSWKAKVEDRFGRKTDKTTWT